MNQGESIITSLEALRMLRQTRYNPLRGITAGKLAALLDSFELGELRDCALLWEQIAERDDTVKSVKPKREKSVSGLEPVYQALPGSGGAGAAQAETLKDFWSGVRATNAYDRNVSGGLRLFIQQMMTSISYRYAVHHIVWAPRAGGLSATFEMVPLWLFENKTGKLRYLKNPYDLNGVDMADEEWLVTAGEGLMIACSIGWLAKRETFNDWLIFSKNFSIPGVLGRTKAAKDSPEGRAMRAAVLAFGQEMKGVLYSDDGSIDKPIEIIQAEGSPNGMPMPSIIERVDRKIAALYRGNDLSTMSAGSGEGSGASLQGDESKILLADDIQLMEEKFAAVSRLVLEWTYGGEVEVMAEVKLLTPEQVAAKAAAVTPITPGAPITTVTPREATANADLPLEDDSSPALDALRAALAADLQPLGDALHAAWQAGDEAAMTAALRKISAGLPDQVGVTDHLTDELASQLAAELAATEEEANGDFSGHPFRGNQHHGITAKGTSREGETARWQDTLGALPDKNGFLTPALNEARMHRALSRCTTLQRDVPKAAFRDGLGQVDLPYGRPGNPALAYEGGYGASHIAAKHGPEVLSRLPQIIAHGALHPHDTDPDKRYLASGKDLVVIGRKDARHAWVISSFTDIKTTTRIHQGR